MMRAAPTRYDAPRAACALYFYARHRCRAATRCCYRGASMLFMFDAAYAVAMMRALPCRADTLVADYAAALISTLHFSPL